MSSPHGDTPEEFLTALEAAYFTAKRMRRSIRMDDSLAGGLGLDSLDALEVLLALEQHYGITLIDTEQVSRVQTVAELHAVVTGLVAAR